MTSNSPQLEKKRGEGNRERECREENGKDRGGQGEMRKK